ncbi:unnamed protein product, partial [Amoebophrya sp. A120]|eukprot:GSA120T00003289001.1
MSKVIRFFFFPTAPVFRELQKWSRSCVDVVGTAQAYTLTTKRREKLRTVLPARRARNRVLMTMDRQRRPARETKAEGRRARVHHRRADTIVKNSPPLKRHHASSSFVDARKNHQGDDSQGQQGGGWSTAAEVLNHVEAALRNLEAKVQEIATVCKKDTASHALLDVSGNMAHLADDSQCLQRDGPGALTKVDYTRVGAAVGETGSGAQQTADVDVELCIRNGVAQLFLNQTGSHLRAEPPVVTDPASGEGYYERTEGFATFVVERVPGTSDISVQKQAADRRIIVQWPHQHSRAE